jgi:hypothetical protein
MNILNFNEEMDLVNLDDFNNVTNNFISFDRKIKIEEWLINPSNKKLFKINMTPIFFEILKKTHDWKTFVEDVKCIVVNTTGKSLKDIFGEFNKKNLFYFLFLSADDECKMKITQLMSEYNPIPFLQPIVKKDQLSYNVNENVFYSIDGNHKGILSLGIGLNATEKIGKSYLINKLFFKNFEINDTSPLSVNSIDIDLDINTRKTRNYAIADCHGKLKVKNVENLFKLFKIIMFHFSAKNSKTFGDDEIKILEKTTDKNKILFLIRDIDEIETNGSEFEQSIYSDEVQQEKSKLEEYFPFIKQLRQRFSNIKFIVFKKIEREENNSSSGQSVDCLRKIKSFIEKLISESKFENNEYFNKETLIEFLSCETDSTEIKEINESVKELIASLTRYKINFFDETIFPTRILLKAIKDNNRTSREQSTKESFNEFEKEKHGYECKLQRLK